jgi:hypothetical protein
MVQLQVRGSLEVEQVRVDVELRRHDGVEVLDTAVCHLGNGLLVLYLDEEDVDDQTLSE